MLYLLNPRVWIALAIVAASGALQAAWLRVVYHAGDLRQADLLWPALYDLATA